MKKTITILGLAVCLAACCNQPQQSTECNADIKTATVTVQKVWDQGEYDAFTSIVKYNGKYYISFREAKSHIFDENGKAEGKCCVIMSEDGVNWKMIAALGKKDYDLRDPKLSIMPDGRLMMIMGASLYVDRELIGCYPQVSFCEDGENFCDPIPCELTSGDFTPDHNWLWRVTWGEKEGFAINYGVGYTVNKVGNGTGEMHCALMKTTDGIHYELVKDISEVDGDANEATVRIAKDGTMFMMIRRETESQNGFWGVSKYPYTDWEWKEMEFRIGGPDFIITGENEDNIIAGGRVYWVKSHARTALLKGTPDGDFEEVYLLPSGGDNSYPGFIIEGDELWVSYYSSHDHRGRASIYLAKMPLSMFD